MKKPDIRTKKGIRTIVIILLILAGLAATGLFIWDSVKKAVIRRSIVRAVRDKSNGLYSLWYKKLDLNEVAGTLHLQKLSITHNMTVYKERESEKNQPPVLVAVQVPDIYVTGIKTTRAMLNREIVGRKIVIDHPVIDIVLTRGQAKDTTVIYDTAFYRQLLGKLELISMDTITINNALVNVKEVDSKENKITATNVSLQLRGLLIDSLSGRDRNRLLFSKDISLQCDSMDIRSTSGKYTNTIRDLRFSQSERTFTIGRVVMAPPLSESEFASSFNVQKDRFDFDIRNIRLAGIDINSLERGELRADSLILKKGTYKIYRDLSYRRSEESRVGKYPQQLLLAFKVPLLVDHVLCPSAYVEYKERNPKSEKSGRVQFYDVSAYISHVTNIKEEMTRNNICTVNLHAKFLNEAPLQAVITFYLNDKEGRFGVKGSLGGINAKDLNVLSEPMGLVKIETGNVDKLSFALSGNDYAAHGNVTLLYHDLKISILKKEKETNNMEKRPLASFAANLIVQNENPGKNKKLRVANVQYKRDTTRSFFNLVWKSIFAGVKESAGLKSGTDQ